MLTECGCGAPCVATGNPWTSIEQATSLCFTAGLTSPVLHWRKPDAKRAKRAEWDAKRGQRAGADRQHAFDARAQLRHRQVPALPETRKSKPGRIDQRSHRPIDDRS